MRKRGLSIVLMAVGIAVVLLGMVLPSRLPGMTQISAELADEYSKAAAAYHAATSLPLHQRNPRELLATRERFEEAKRTVEEIRSRGESLRRWLSVTGYILLLGGGILYLSQQPTA